MLTFCKSLQTCNFLMISKVRLIDKRADKSTNKPAETNLSSVKKRKRKTYCRKKIKSFPMNYSIECSLKKEFEIPSR